MDEMALSRQHCDEHWMRHALEQASLAEKSAEVPVGAVIVLENKVVGAGFNRNRTDSDPTAHAEIIALRAAAKTLGNYRLEGCSMFATIEPCAMCAGALVHARIARLVYGADDPKAGAVHSVLGVLNHPQLNHQMEVVGGVLGGECGEMLQSFFQARRNKL